jgi:hypothetical protein
MKMPAPDPNVLERRAEIVAGLRAIVPGEGVIDTHEELRAYESDGLTAYRQVPMVVVLPETTEQVSRVLKFCHEAACRWCRAAAARRCRAAPCRSPTGCCWGWASSTASWKSTTTTAASWPSPA